jgi:hypothetical protein
MSRHKGAVSLNNKAFLHSQCYIAERAVNSAEGNRGYNLRRDEKEYCTLYANKKETCLKRT